MQSFMPASVVITRRTCHDTMSFLFFVLYLFSFFFLVFLLFAALKVFCKISILVCRYASQHPSSCELINQNVCANKSPKNASKKNLVEIRPKCQIVSQPAREWPPYGLTIVYPSRPNQLNLLNPKALASNQLHARIFKRLSKHKRILKIDHKVHANPLKKKKIFTKKREAFKLCWIKIR